MGASAFSGKSTSAPGGRIRAGPPQAPPHAPPNSTAFSPPTTTLGLRTGVLYGGPAADLDGDGYADVYSGTALYRGGPAGATPFRSYNERFWSTARMVDMDGDGRLDIVQVGYGKPHSRLDIVRNLPAP